MTGSTMNIYGNPCTSPTRDPVYPHIKDGILHQIQKVLLSNLSMVLSFDVSANGFCSSARNLLFCQRNPTNETALKQSLLLVVISYLKAFFSFEDKDYDMWTCIKVFCLSKNCWSITHSINLGLKFFRNLCEQFAKPPHVSETFC